MEVRNKRWTDEEFFEARKQVLTGWPTGKEVDLDESIEYHKQIPPQKTMRNRIARAKTEGVPMFSKALGRATLEETIAHLQYLVDEAGAESFEIFHDTYTRKCQYELAQRGLDESIKQGKSILNGYPIVNYGPKKTRRIVETASIPLRHWGGTDEDPRLAVEIGLASGFTGMGVHDIHDLMHHSKRYPIDLRIRNNQYCLKLISYYIERGAPIEVWSPGSLSGWNAPGMKLVVLILQALTAAEQGVKDFTAVYVSTGHLIQNVAAIRVLPKLIRSYLNSFGYKDINLSTQYGTWQGDWPQDLQRATGQHAWEVAMGILGGADLIWYRGVDEAIGLNTKESDAAALKIARQLAMTIGRLRLPQSEELRLEEEMLALEVKAIVDRVIDLGDGDIAAGEIRGVEQGVLDIAFSPYVPLAQKVIPVRDIDGAIRYLDHGNLPLPAEVVKYHRNKIAEREKAEGLKADIEMVISDVLFMSRPLAKGNGKGGPQG